MTYGEKRVMHDIMTALSKAGWKPTYTDATDDDTYVKVRSIKAAIESVDTVDMATVTFSKKGCNNMGILFVLGNDPSGCEVASDWNVNDHNDFDKILSSVNTEAYA